VNLPEVEVNPNSLRPKNILKSRLPVGKSSRTNFGYAIFEHPTGLPQYFIHSSASMHATASVIETSMCTYIGICNS
jgi:hypothetical protein